MSRRKKEPLRTLTDEERTWLERISRSQSEAASHVARAKQILNVANGYSYQEAAFLSGRKSGDAVSNLVKWFNQEGLNAIQLGMEAVPQPSMVRLSANGFCRKSDRNRTLRRMARPPGL